MNKIKIKGIDETIYYKKLDNGLDVYTYNKESTVNYYVSFTTKFGSINTEFKNKNEKKYTKVPYGVAHFLEHKLFAQEKGPQPEEFFAQNGANCNAYTTFKNTTYLFSGPKNLKENLEFLLDYVQKPYFTKENVEIEKGIINQEINMCNDNIPDILYEHIRKNTLTENPYKDSIIGTKKDIKKISPEILTKCYNTFYNPNNMFLVVAGNVNPEEIINIVEENQLKKEFPKNESYEIKKYKEKDEVTKEREIIKKETNIAKFSYNIKIKIPKDINKRKYNLYLYLIFSILFDDTSTLDEELKKEGIITSPIAINTLNCDTHIILSLINETNHYKKLENKIEKVLNNIKITEEDLERKKKVLISNEIFSYENIEVINEMIVDSIIFDNKIEDNMIGLIKSINYKELNEIIKELNLKNKSIIIIENNI